jgi:hypothetical protein
MKTPEQKAEDYFNSLTEPLADPKGLVITAFISGYTEKAKELKESVSTLDDTVNPDPKPPKPNE